MDKNEQWLKWAVELQAIAQGGLFYGKDKFDIERYERIREISAEMISYKTEISADKVQNLFCSDVGYQTSWRAASSRFCVPRMLVCKNSCGFSMLRSTWLSAAKFTT